MDQGEFYMNLFFDESSSEGIVKTTRMTARFLAPAFKGQTPAHRITWERLQELSATHKKKTVEKMRQAPGGGEVAEIYENLSTVGPIELFCSNVTNDFLPSIVPGYRPEYGFDWDAFMFVTNEDVADGIRLYFEIFPRLRSGEMVSSYASLVHAEIPYFFGVRENDQLITMGAFIHADTLVTSEELRRKQIITRHCRWTKHTGVWPIEKEPWTSLFVNRAAMSAIEDGLTGPRPIVSPGVSYDFKGAPKEASLQIR